MSKQNKFKPGDVVKGVSGWEIAGLGVILQQNKKEGYYDVHFYNYPNIDNPVIGVIAEGLVFVRKLSKLEKAMQ